MSFDERPFVKEEVETLQRSIESLLKKAQNCARAQQQQEHLLISTLSHAAQGRGASAPSPTEIEELSQKIEDFAEEEDIEEECLRRYEAFLKKERRVLAWTSAKAKDVIAKLSMSFPQCNDESQLPAGDCGLLHPDGAVSVEIKELGDSWQTIALLHKAAQEVLSHQCTSSAAAEVLDWSVEQRKCSHHCKKLEDVVYASSQTLRSIEDRILNLELQIESLRAEVESDATPNVNCEGALPEATVDRNIIEAKSALQELQAAADEWLHKKDEVDSERSSLMNALKKTTNRTGIYNRAACALVATTKEVDDILKKVAQENAELSRQVSSKQNRVEVQTKQLKDEEALHKALCDKISQLQEKEISCNAQLKKFESTLQIVRSDLDGGRKTRDSLAGRCSAAAQQIGELQTEKRMLLEEIAYYNSLIPESTVGTQFEFAKVGGKSCADAFHATSCYLDFVHKARSSRRRMQYD